MLITTGAERVKQPSMIMRNQLFSMTSQCDNLRVQFSDWLITFEVKHHEKHVVERFSIQCRTESNFVIILVLH